MGKIITKINTTGSLYEDNINHDIVSYSTPIYREFQTNKGLIKVFNNTYYSATTRKHQSRVSYLKDYADYIFNYCPYGNWSLETGLKNEITMTEYELEKLQNKTRKLGKRQAEKLETLKTKLQTLQDLYAEV